MAAFERQGSLLVPTQERFLTAITDHCFLQSSPFHTEAAGGPNSVTIDHVFNKMAKGRYPKVLRPFFNGSENKTPLCNSCHHRVDQGEAGKVAAFRTYGIKGLVEWNAAYYPLPGDEQSLKTMEFQFRLLFRRFSEEARHALNKGQHRPEQLGDLTTALHLSEFHTAQWDAGKFAERRRGFRGLNLDQ